ncbi:flagellar biosynthesis protein FlhB [Hyphomicrobium sp.]|uniref:flagellar biosynthesis protein FlhB n=1 Tax=Hyphomicrobium sp. TaxID=82 RepID=UPI0025BBB460|nr:flagellar biosynthesis protein FlhB [Hyphomicrobium sp.]MCC7253290.1 flagellar biosynthesis protein FlhB [Hyphomicrobium sp.]
MAEQPDKESKTEEATEKKIRDSLDKGQVPHSREATTLASMLAILIAVVFLLSDNVIKLKSALATFIDRPESFLISNGADASAILMVAVLEGAKVVGPIIIVLAMAGVAGSVFQNQPRFVFDRIEPKLERISIIKGWSRIFGLKGQVEFLKSLFKLSIVALGGYIALKSSYVDIFNALFMEPTATPKLMQDLSVRFLSAVAAATAVLVAADLAWSRFSWRRDLRMTRQEVKDEHKQVEGDPLIKMRLRSLQRDRARRRMIASVPRATLIIANPTHYSVALRYVREEGGAPVVVAKGKDLIALKIRFIAEQNGIPVYEDRSLARSLYASVEVDKMIPPEFYKAVAGVILFLAQRGQARRAM